jgi:hypothetical protein
LHNDRPRCCCDAAFRLRRDRGRGQRTGIGRDTGAKSNAGSPPTERGVPSVKVVGRVVPEALPKLFGAFAEEINRRGARRVLVDYRNAEAALDWLTESPA